MWGSYLERCYNRVMSWSRHPKACFYLGVVSFVDSSVFPISPVLMLVPMVIAKPKSAFYLAFLATITSVIGGFVGYALGVFALDFCVQPFITWMGYTEYFQSVLQWFQEWGFWALLLACFVPVPYKIFTIGAGVVQLNLGLFFLASLLGRGLRFCVIAALLRWGGPHFELYFKRAIARL